MAQNSNGAWFENMIANRKAKMEEEKAAREERIQGLVSKITQAPTDAPVLLTAAELDEGTVLLVFLMPDGRLQVSRKNTSAAGFEPLKEADWVLEHFDERGLPQVDSARDARYDGDY